MDLTIKIDETWKEALPMFLAIYENEYEHIKVFRQYPNSQMLIETCCQITSGLVLYLLFGHASPNKKVDSIGEDGVYYLKITPEEKHPGKYDGHQCIFIKNDGCVYILQSYLCAYRLRRDAIEYMSLNRILDGLRSEDDKTRSQAHDQLVNHYLRDIPPCRIDMILFDHFPTVDTISDNLAVLNSQK